MARPLSRVSKSSHRRASSIATPRSPSPTEEASSPHSGQDPLRTTRNHRLAMDLWRLVVVLKAKVSPAGLGGGIGAAIGDHLRDGQSFELFECRDVVVVAVLRIAIHEFGELRLQVLINVPNRFEEAPGYCQVVATFDRVASCLAPSDRNLALSGQPEMHP